MEDIEARLAAERPEVADALRSMNWDERLAEARARRQAVLVRNEKAGKPRTVRIVDAGIMARRRADPAAGSSLPAGPVLVPEAAVTAERTDMIEAPAPAPAAAPVPVVVEADPAARTQRPSIAARTALGFGLGLGLGLGASALGAVYLLFMEPAAIPGTTSASAAGAPVAVLPAATTGPAAAVSAADGAAFPALSPAVAPTPAAVLDVVAVAPVEAASLPAALPAPQFRNSVTAPRAAAPSRGFSLQEPPPAAAFAATSVTPPAAAVGEPSPGLPALANPDEIARSVPRPFDTRPSGSPPIPAGHAVPLRPFAEVAPAAIADVEPGGVRPPLAVAMTAPPRHPSPPVPPGAGNAADTVPTTAAPPPPAAQGPVLAGASALSIRLAVPGTVPDAEADEVATLLRDLGVGESRVTRVGFKVSETHVRYYRPADAAVATTLAGIMGTEARDHSAHRPSPPEGTIEIFLSGERTSPPPRIARTGRAAAAPRAPAAPRAATPQPPRAEPSDELTRMRDRIVTRMRRGEHL